MKRIGLLCVDDLTVLLKEIMQEARSLTSAEKCSVFLMDRDTNELVAKVFDGDIAESQVILQVVALLFSKVCGLAT